MPCSWQLANCDLSSLKAHIEGNNSGLQGFLQFGKPIWLTEVSCDGTHPVADQQAYMQAAVPYLEGNAYIFRYSWFSSSWFSTLKNELGERFETSGVAKAEVFDYIEVFYNQQRRHSALNYQSPAAYERIGLLKRGSVNHASKHL
jgi:hypothetical protein